MPRRRTLRLAAVLALVFVLPLPARSQDDPLAGFHDYVRQAVESWEAPGLAVAVVKDDSLVFARGYGVLEKGTDQEVDPNTLFAIGSTTKAMTAAAIGMLVDEGKLAWDDPVIDHLPWFRLEDPWLTREVTIRDLLTHRAGLGNADMIWYGQPQKDTREIVEALRHLEPAYSLRSGFIYQNIMYATAGEVIEAVSGMTWEGFLRTRIFEPLRMTRTAATLSEAETRSNVARPHDRVDGEIRVIENATVDPVRAAGSVWSSVTEMSRWVRALLRGCRTEDGQVLLEAGTCQELFTPQALIRNGFYPTTRLTDPHWTTYGMGWFQQDYEGRKVDFHTGSIDGMVAIAGLIRDENLGVYVLANRDHVELRHALMWRAFDLYDPEPARDWSADLKELYDELAARQDSALAAFEADRIQGTEPSLPPEEVAGTYVHPMYGAVEVTASDRGLRVSFGRRQGTARHWHYDTYRVHWDAEWRGTSLVTFELDARGRPSTLRVMGLEFQRQPDESSDPGPGEG